MKQSQKGITLFLVIVILAVVLAAAIGLGTIFVSQLKIIAGIGNSVKALYAADTGIEMALKDILVDVSPQASYDPVELENGTKYEVEVFCCQQSEDYCEWTDEDPCPITEEDSECQATRYCVRSRGSFEKTNRAIEVKISPVED